jgi:hypothetical protein
MMPDISKLILTAEDHWIISASLLGALIFLIFVIGYVRGQSEKTTASKIWDMVLMVFYIKLFLFAILGGLYLGKIYGNTAIGFCAGLFIFWFVFQVMAWIKKKRTKL